MYLTEHHKGKQKQNERKPKENEKKWKENKKNSKENGRKIKGKWMDPTDHDKGKNRRGMKGNQRNMKRK